MTIAQLDHEHDPCILTETGKDFERLGLVFQEDGSDNHRLEHGGPWDLVGRARLSWEASLQGRCAYRNRRKISSTSASAGEKAPPRQN